VKSLVVNSLNLEFDVMTDRFAHAVYFDLPDDVLLSDAYFDMLPGEIRHITAQADAAFALDTVVQARSVHIGILC